MNKLLVYRIAGIAVPVVAVALSALLGILQVKRLRKANTDLDNTQKQILSVDGLIRQIESEPPPSKYPTAVASADEQPGFLSTLRSAAETCHVQVTRWTNISEDMQAPGAAKSAAAKPAGVPADVTPVASTIEVHGAYENVRRYINALIASPRLLNLTNLHWMRGLTWPDTSAAFTITRYTAPDGKASWIYSAQGGKPIPIAIEPGAQASAPAPDKGVMIPASQTTPTPAAGRS